MARLIAAVVLVCRGLAAAAPPAGDARRGEGLFRQEQCIQCHSVDGSGAKPGGDLSKRIDRDFTPALMASLMWNHAPDMWAAMKSQGIVKAQLSPDGAADLFAFFISARYFEKPGDAGRGKLAFGARHCADCHGIVTSPMSGAPPVAKWESLADPVVLAQQMWNHAPKMRAEFLNRKLAWWHLTAQELTDILVYLQNLPETRNIPRSAHLPSPEPGEKLFQSKGCLNCHTGKLALEDRLRNQTLTEIAVDMWNHQPAVKQPAPVFTEEEMREVLEYVWARQYFRGHGNAERGKSVFREKGCATCHNDPASGAPRLAGGGEVYSDVTMVSILWEHGPRMLDQMTQRRLAWPRFTAPEMSDLIAYLNAQ
ncbi:MAG TPA: c-type cytochrome [Bryobacteraceae bacterium]|nr:c-type cytochrome [Bryobacteraceae bacterium]